jgi:hypothetical protein
MNAKTDLRPSTADRRTLTSNRRFSAIVSSLPSEARGPATYLALSALVATVYVVFALVQNRGFGFPLDDAWIHQVYARNLGTRGEFAFFPAQPSAGSTSPLWALMLGAGYAPGIDFRLWTILLAVSLVALSAILCARIAGRLGAPAFVACRMVPLFVIFEWHLAWASVSGMEIPLFILLSLALIELFLASSHPFWMGMVAGLLTLTRPEGAALGLLVATTLAMRTLDGRTREEGINGDRSRYSNLLLFGLAFVLPLMPYIAFNVWSSGTIFPNTFYAKSQEYGELLSHTNFLARWLALYRQPFLGAQILLLPGLLWMGWRLLGARQLAELIPLAWVGLLPALYAARLPVDYQFGRYEMPIIPFIGIYGIVGTWELLARIRTRAVRRAWGLAIAVLVIAFAWLGANQYAGSVAIVNCEMVATARWTAANLPPGALIAAHDIGAQGYFDSHPILDLAGLVSPEVIPFIRDEDHLHDWMKSRGATYAIFFPTWYRQLASDAGFVPVHSENCAVTRAAGEVDLTVYSVTR